MMNSLPGVTKLLTESRNLKSKVLDSPSALSQLDAGAKKFSRIGSKSGTVYIWSDTRCLFSGLHLAEELQVRFKSGAPFNRPDRRAVPVENLSAYPLEAASKIIERNIRENDALVIFSSEAFHSISPLQEIAKKKNAYHFDSFSITGPTSFEAALFSLHRVILHVLCEGAEPEYQQSDIAKSTIQDALDLEGRLLNNQKFLSQIEISSNNLIQRSSQGGAIYTCGNGGSACDALEITRYFQEFKTSNKTPLRAHHFLDGAYLTCAINDGFPLFARGVEGISGDKNTLILITTSGKSENLVEAAKLARQKNIKTIGFLPESGGPILPLIDEPIMVPTQVGFRIQEIHALLGAMLIN